MKKVASGLAIGVVNGFFGSAGGIVAVQLLTKLGVEEKKAHATAILIILPLSLASAVVYYLAHNIDFSGNTWLLLGGGAAGGILGAFLLCKLKGEWIDAIFTVLILASGIRMVL